MSNCVPVIIYGKEMNKSTYIETMVIGALLFPDKDHINLKLKFRVHVAYGENMTKML